MSSPPTPSPPYPVPSPPQQRGTAGLALFAVAFAVLLSVLLAFLGFMGLTALRHVSAGPSDFPDNCFGYSRKFRSGSTVLKVDWTGDGGTDECFGIAPDRTIWHAWPGSGSWVLMPNDGIADQITGFTKSSGQRTIVVSVDGKGLYCSSLGHPYWQPWFRCEKA